MVFYGAFDASFIDLVLQYEGLPSEELLHEICKHEAAIGIHDHALRFRNTAQNRGLFWKRILDDVFAKGEQVKDRIRQSVEYLQRNNSILNGLLKEVASFLPSGIELEFKIYGEVGYDIGIVSQGNAFLNLAAMHYQQNQTELLYFAMHESHHVGYTHYNPIYSLSTLNTTSDLLNIIRYSTHLEGLATYVPIERRYRNKDIAHEDYKVLLNSKKSAERCKEYWTLIEELENDMQREILAEDFEIIERMSGRNKRLWYIAGAEMSRMIDENLGRKRLCATVKKGPMDFFSAYEEIA